MKGNRTRRLTLVARAGALSSMLLSILVLFSGAAPVAAENANQPSARAKTYTKTISRSISNIKRAGRRLTGSWDCDSKISLQWTDTGPTVDTWGTCSVELVLRRA